MFPYPVEKPIAKLLLVFSFVSIISQTFAQEGEVTNPNPIGGVSQLALPYYKISFTSQQRKQIENIEIEFIFHVDEKGNATLEKVNGVAEKSILDSLFKVKDLPKFEPRTVNGKAESSVFFMKLRFPEYKVLDGTLTYTYRKHRKITFDDVDSIHKSGNYVNYVIGGVANTFIGNPSKHLATGGGMKMDIIFGKENMGWGFVMNVYGNRLKKNYTINSTRQQTKTPPTLLIGLAANRTVFKEPKKELSLQVELNYAVQNVVIKKNYDDNDYVQFRGFSPGVVASYSLRLGKEHLSYYYWQPMIVTHHINFHGAVRPVFFNHKEASGIMIEIGLSYRLQFHLIDAFRLKPDFTGD